MTNIFVGNLSYQTTQEELQAAFAQYGAVERVNIVTDRDTGQPRGFAFVEMTEKRDATNAIAQLNGAELHGRAMNVNEARPEACLRIRWRLRRRWAWTWGQRRWWRRRWARTALVVAL